MSQRYHQATDHTEWPIAIITAAEKSGALTVTTQRAITILEDFQALGSKPVQTFCKDHQIEPTTLSLLAKILLRTRIRGHNPLAQRLLLAASGLGDSAATFLLIKEAIKFKRLRSPDLAGPQRHLGTLADVGNPAAMYLAGQISEYKGKSAHAIEIYEKATESIGGAPEGINAPNNILRDIWKAMSRAKAFLGDHDGAEAAIRTCALQLDDPVAYYELAKSFTSPSSQDYEVYMLKAAASGEPKAAHELGVLYHKQSQGGTLASRNSISSKRINKSAMPKVKNVVDGQGLPLLSSKIVSEKSTQAREWLTIGAESDIPVSQLYLAVLLRAAGKSNEGFEWLARTPGSGNWYSAMSWLRSMWERKDPIDIDTVSSGKYDPERIQVTACGESISIPQRFLPTT